MGEPVITIFVRHGADKEGKPCKFADDEFAKNCKCRKHFRYSHKGKQYRRKAGTRSWAEAEELKRKLQDELAGRTVEPETDHAQTIADEIDVFITKKELESISAGVVSRYRSELGRFKAFCAKQKVYTVPAINEKLLIKYAGTWEATYPSSNTRSSVRERLRTFLRHCYGQRLFDRIPPVPRVKVDEPETMPLTPEEYAKVLDTIDTTRPLRFDVKGIPRLLGPETKKRLRALIQLMRWSGLSIQDAVKIPRANIIHDKAKKIYRVVTARQKTGTDVSVPIPTDVAESILAVTSPNPSYVFWNGTSKRSQVIMWGSRYMRPLFDHAGVSCGHMVSHRLRDTFAVELLKKGVPMEEVSKLLGHKSIKVTEKHYAKWVQGRQDRLDNLVLASWATA